jgi:hypothetical protein
MDIVTTRLGRYLKAVSSTVLGCIPAGRDLTVLPDDIFLVSYRRSGSTWLRFLVGNLIQETSLSPSQTWNGLYRTSMRFQIACFVGHLES